MFSLISTVYPIKFLSPPPIFSALDFHPTLPVYMHAQLQLPDDSECGLSLVKDPQHVPGTADHPAAIATEWSKA